jgi:hypothetical protein
VASIDMMIKHKLNSDWTPPIRELLAANASSGRKRIKTIYKSDIKTLLDKVASIACAARDGESMHRCGRPRRCTPAC